MSEKKEKGHADSDPITFQRCMEKLLASLIHKWRCDPRIW